jgi:hypothetical protein
MSITDKDKKEMKEYMLSFKNRLLKVKLKTRDEFTADCI